MKIQVKKITSKVRQSMNLFHRKKVKAESTPLHVTGVAEAPVTPEPDDAEVAAQALLEIMAEKRRRKRPGKQEKHDAHKGQPEQEGNGNAPRDKAYYESLADRIRKAHDASRRRTQRFVTFCEYQLQKHGLPVTGEGSLQLLEAELYKRIDIVEREGGDLKSRWQHCLAEVTLRLMNANDNKEEKG